MTTPQPADSTNWPILTRRALIRRTTADDLPALYRIVTLPSVAHMLFAFSPEMPLDEFATHFAIDTTTRPFRAVIEENGRIVGSIGAGEGTIPSIWYFLHPDVAGRGLATEIVTAFVGWLMAQPTVEAITAEVFTNNPGSRRVLEKCGFEVISTSEHQSAARPAPAPVWIMQR